MDGVRYDVCVIGAGPAGLASALRLARQGLRVAIADAGAEQGERTPVPDAEILTPESHAPMTDAVARGLGGTSVLWGGRCVPLDPIDFEPREYVPLSGWPIAASEVEPYYPAACELLAAGQARFRLGDSEAPTRGKGLTSAMAGGLPGFDATRVERWSVRPSLRSPDIAAELRRLGVRVLPRMVCVGLVGGADGGRVRAARFRAAPLERGEVVAVEADAFVLACGGIETTRLILNVMEAADGLALPRPELVGRYYMGHPSGKIAHIHLAGDPRSTIFGFERDGAAYIRRRITPTPEMQRRHRLLNIAFWTDNPPLADPAHGSGILSAAYLALHSPAGRWLAPAGIRKRVAGPHLARGAAHLWNCIRSPIATSFGALAFLRARYLTRPRIPGFHVRSLSNVYGLHFHAEQSPDADNRVELGDARDAWGLRVARISLRWSEADADAIVRAHELLDGALRAAGAGSLVFDASGDGLREAVRQQSVDGYHQIGTLRMDSSGMLGVTDSFGRLHGTTNCYVASSAIFPTSGQANPTLTMVALALRQADHIRHVLAGAAR